MDSSFEHLAEEDRVAPGIGTGRGLEVGNRSLGEEECQHRAHAIDGERERELRENPEKTLFQVTSAALESLPTVRLLERFELRQAARHSEWVSRKRSRLVHR